MRGILLRNSQYDNLSEERGTVRGSETIAAYSVAAVLLQIDFGSIWYIPRIAFRLKLY